MNGKKRPRHLRVVRPEDTLPEELANFERRTDPYANMLPGISSVSLFQTLGEGVSLRRRGHPVLALVSLVLLILFTLPVVLMFVQQILQH